jgi:hypothetical protein
MIRCEWTRYRLARCGILEKFVHDSDRLLTVRAGFSLHAQYQRVISIDLNFILKKERSETNEIKCR